VPHVVDSDLDDVRIGELEGQTIAEYRAWKSHSSREQPFPGGESLDDAARRFAGALASLLNRPERAILVVCHEIPVRYAINAATGSETLDGPVHDVRNALPFVFDERGLTAAVAGINRLTPGGSD
jgi:broad specificity phosphatase PhoE